MSSSFSTKAPSADLSVIEDDVFVKLMPSAPHEVVWQWFQTRLLVNFVAVAGRKSIKIDPLGKPDGILTPGSDPTFANSCPSFIVEVGVSEPFSVLTLDKLWWEHFDKQSKHGKLMLIILIDVNKSAGCVTIHLYTSPDFAQPRTLTLPFEGALPDGAQLEFLPEWFYCGEPPDWLDGKTVVMDSADLDEWRQAVRRHLFPICTYMYHIRPLWLYSFNYLVLHVPEPAPAWVKEGTYWGGTRPVKWTGQGRDAAVNLYDYLCDICIIGFVPKDRPLVDGLRKCIEEAYAKAAYTPVDRLGKTDAVILCRCEPIDESLELYLPASIDGQNVVELIESGIIGKYRITTFGVHLFVQLEG
ncbi:hypothetical protein PENSPDRAFT_738699 [Peniophora sp. CONT]|nr:hypothetical protein PENSPDRAFT_738699 [Peniophora sp. CONT]